MKSSIFRLPATDEVTRHAESIVGQVRECGYALIRGLYLPDELRRCTATIYSYANTAEHLASAGVSRGAVRTNSSKWSIGASSNSQEGIARFMLTIYNPLTCADIFRMHTHFRKVIKVRDILAMREDTFYDDRLPPRLFNATRIQIYPRGGGFMTAHRDMRAAENLKRLSGS